MGATVLGRVTGSMDGPRGPDALHKISVEAGWLEEGATIEFELPRNLACAGCDGGGCSLCGYSGAVSVRGRKEPGEVVQVTLPRAAQPAGAPPSSGKRGVVIRLPEHGGLPEDLSLPRGHLMLSVKVGEPSPGVSLVETEAPAAQPENEGVEAATARPPMPLWLKLLWAALALFLITLFLLRVLGIA